MCVSVYGETVGRKREREEWKVAEIIIFFLKSLSFFPHRRFQAATHSSLSLSSFPPSSLLLNSFFLPSITEWLRSLRSNPIQLTLLFSDSQTRQILRWKPAKEKEEGSDWSSTLLKTRASCRPTTWIRIVRWTPGHQSFLSLPLPEVASFPHPISTSAWISIHPMSNPGPWFLESSQQPITTASWEQRMKSDWAQHHSLWRSRRKRRVCVAHLYFVGKGKKGFREIIKLTWNE